MDGCNISLRPKKAKKEKKMADYVLPDGTFQNVRVVSLPADALLAGKSNIVSGTFNVVSAATLAQYTVTGGIELTVPAALENKYIKIEDISLLLIESPSVYTEFIAVVGAGALPTQTANDAPVSVSGGLIGKNYFGAITVNNGTSDGLLYRWGAEDIGGLLKIDSSLKIHVVFAHVTAAVTYSAATANNAVSVAYTEM